jgi:hypothetical protein
VLHVFEINFVSAKGLTPKPAASFLHQEIILSKHNLNQGQLLLWLELA